MHTAQILDTTDKREINMRYLAMVQSHWTLVTFSNNSKNLAHYQTLSTFLVKIIAAQSSLTNAQFI